MLEHVYYWAWSEEDNPNGFGVPENLKKYRVFRAAKSSTRGIPMTEIMSREESIEYCERIVRLTEGKGY
jgi:hypothetical protein